MKTAAYAKSTLTLVLCTSMAASYIIFGIGLGYPFFYGPKTRSRPAGDPVWLSWLVVLFIIDGAVTYFPPEYSRRALGVYFERKLWHLVFFQFFVTAPCYALLRWKFSKLWIIPLLSPSMLYYWHYGYSLQEPFRGYVDKGPAYYWLGVCLLYTSPSPRD